MTAPRRSLKSALASLCQEIDVTLSRSTPLPSATRFEADRIVVSLHLAWVEQIAADGTVELAWVVPETPAPAGQPSHTLTFEFKVRVLPADKSLAQPAPAQRPEPVAAQCTTLEGEEAERVVTLLAQLFGAPGFDSSARATVFREALQDLGEPQVQAAIQALGGKSLTGVDHPSKRARHLVSGVIKSGPLGSFERGVDMLENLFQQHPVLPILRLIEARWRTQQDWVDSPNR